MGLTIMADYLEIMMILLTTFLLLVVYLWTTMTNSKGKVISPITNWPILGMLPGLLLKAKDIHNYATELLKQSGGTFEFNGPWFSNMNMLLTSDPTNVRHISTKNFLNYQKGAEYKKIFEPFGDGVLNSDFEAWKGFRKLIHAMIRDKKFRVFLERSMRDKVKSGLIPVLDDACGKVGGEVDLQDLFQRFTFDNICLLVMGFDPGSLKVGLPEIEYKRAFDHVEEAIFYRHIVPEAIWRFQKWLKIGEEKKLSRAMEVIDGFLEKSIALKKEEFLQRKNGDQEEEEEDYYDLITACIEQEEEEKREKEETMVGNPKPETYLRDIGFNFIAAGKDTVNAALTWFFYLVATNSSTEEKILKEIRSTLGGAEWRFFTLEELNKLVYLHGAICETLRLYPAVPFNHRVAVEEDTLPSGHRVKPNTRVMFSLYSMGSMEDIWGKDCLEFKPERWINDNGGIVHVPSYKFTAFNTGPRSCLGKEVTFIQMKIIASALLWNYHVRLVEGHPVAPCLSVMLHMKHGLKVNVSKRDQRSFVYGDLID